VVSYGQRFRHFAESLLGANCGRQAGFRLSEKDEEEGEGSQLRPKAAHNLRLPLHPGNDGKHGSKLRQSSLQQSLI
jgi:hypothetical protein